MEPGNKAIYANQVLYAFYILTCIFQPTSHKSAECYCRQATRNFCMTNIVPTEILPYMQQGCIIMMASECTYIHRSLCTTSHYHCTHTMYMYIPEFIYRRRVAWIIVRTGDLQDIYTNLTIKTHKLIRDIEVIIGCHTMHYICRLLMAITVYRYSQISFASIY